MPGWPLRLGGYGRLPGEGPGVLDGNRVWPRPYYPPGVLQGQASKGLLCPRASSPDSKRALDPNYRKWLGQPSPCMI